MSPPTTATPTFTAADAGLATLMAILFVLLVSLVREPARQRFMAVFVAGAGAAYFNGGLGMWELAFTAVVTYLAYRGLHSYVFIAAAWFLHAGWDLAHHYWGRPILYFAPASSGQCAVTDTLIAVWFMAGAPSVYAAAAARLRLRPR